MTSSTKTETMELGEVAVDEDLENSRSQKCGLSDMTPMNAFLKSATVMRECSNISVRMSDVAASGCGRVEISVK